jgi:uncharacterized protein (TIGR03663 family)
MNRWLGLGLLLIAIGALALRSFQPELRPMHNDEGVNALMVQKLWKQGVYKYDPEEYHGPSLHYATLPFITLTGARDISQIDETVLRSVPIAFGVAVILLLWLLSDGLGRATLPAGILLAISPAMVFYSRYYIHEMLLICFTLLAIGAGWRYNRTRHIGWAMICGVGIGLMYATKETFVIALFAMVFALGATIIWTRATNETTVRDPFYWNLKHILAALICAGMVSILLFTSFFHNPEGIVDSIKAYLPWTHRAGNSPHAHPWYWYLQRLFWFHPYKGPVWTEGLVLILALAGAFGAITRKHLGGVNPTLARFLTLYTIALTIVYSGIAYKTPLCMLGFFQGMILLGGIGVAVLYNFSGNWIYRIALTLALAVATIHLGWESWRANYGITREGKIFAADNRNPYAYSQTLPNILELVQHIQGIAKTSPANADLTISVIAPEHDYWPLPYYLRSFGKVGYWDNVDTNRMTPIMVVSSDFKAALDEKTSQKWFSAGYYPLRPKVFFELYVQFDLWKNYVEHRPRPQEE